MNYRTGTDQHRQDMPSVCVVCDSLKPPTFFGWIRAR